MGPMSYEPEPLLGPGEFIFPWGGDVSVDRAVANCGCQ